jgi:hypothetical protein
LTGPGGSLPSKVAGGVGTVAPSLHRGGVEAKTGIARGIIRVGLYNGVTGPGIVLIKRRGGKGVQSDNVFQAF